MSGELPGPADVNRWFGRHVQAELRARGWSARELARRAACSPSTFTRTARGQGIALGHAVRIAVVLGVPFGELIRPVSCGTCAGRPPARMTCQDCGAEGGRQ